MTKAAKKLQRMTDRLLLRYFKIMARDRRRGHKSDR